MCLFLQERRSSALLLCFAPQKASKNGTADQKERGKGIASQQKNTPPRRVFSRIQPHFSVGRCRFLSKATPSFCGGGKGRFLKPKATPFCGDSSRLIAMPYRSASPLFHIVFMSGFCKIIYMRFCIKIPILRIICIVLFTFLEVLRGYRHHRYYR